MSPASWHMECYDSGEWQANFYNGPCLPCTTRSQDLDDADFDEEIRVAREEYLQCKLLCETAYCNSICNDQYQQKLAEIYEKYGKS